MKNNIFKLFIFCLLSTFMYGQKEINKSWKNYINPIFQGLDKTKVPHAVLLDYAMEFTNVPAYSGTLTDSTYVDMNSFSNIYKTLYMGKVTNDTIYFPRIHKISYNLAKARVDNNMSYRNTLVITGLLYKYSIINPNALSQSKITVSNNKYYDRYISGVWQNPYQTKVAIAFSLPSTTYNKRNLKVILPNDLMLTNRLSEIQKIEFNANDGLGYRQINFNQSLNVNYGYNGIYTWVFKITLNTNQILYSHTKIEIKQEFTSTKWEDRYGNQ